MSPRESASQNRQRADRRFAVANEHHLHAALKSWYAQPHDRLETPVEGFVIDIVRGDLLIEIQTAAMGSMKRKVSALIQNHPVRVVYPVAHRKWLVKQQDDAPDAPPDRRRSPKKGRIEDVFHQFVSLAHLAPHRNFSLEVLLTEEEEVRRHAPGQCWRRKGWAIEERRLLEVVGQHFFENPLDYASLLSPDLPSPFTTADIARTLNMGRLLAQRMAYCLRRMEVIVAVGRSRQGLLYERCMTGMVCHHNGAPDVSAIDASPSSDALATLET